MSYSNGIGYSIPIALKAFCFFNIEIIVARIAKILGLLSLIVTCDLLKLITKAALCKIFLIVITI